MIADKKTDEKLPGCPTLPQVPVYMYVDSRYPWPMMGCDCVLFELALRLDFR